MAEPDLAWTLTWADFTGFAEGRTRILARGSRRARLPKAHVEAFRTKAEAEAAEARLRATGDGIVTSVVPVTVKAAKPSPALLDDWPLMPKRLTR